MPVLPPPRPSAVPPGDPVIDALVQASFTTMALLTKAAAENDLSLTQLRVLAILRDRTVRMSALADHLGLEKSSMSGLVARAEQRGLLERIADPSDGRAVEVRLTAQGAAFAERVGRRIEEVLAPMTGALGASDQRRLGALLEQML